MKSQKWYSEQIHKYKYTSTQIHKYTVMKCRKYPTSAIFSKSQGSKDIKNDILNCQKYKYTGDAITMYLQIWNYEPLTHWLTFALYHQVYFHQVIECACVYTGCLKKNWVLWSVGLTSSLTSNVQIVCSLQYRPMGSKIFLFILHGSKKIVKIFQAKILSGTWSKYTLKNTKIRKNPKFWDLWPQGHKSKTIRKLRIH